MNEQAGPFSQENIKTTDDFQKINESFFSGSRQLSTEDLNNLDDFCWQELNKKVEKLIEKEIDEHIINQNIQ